MFSRRTRWDRTANRLSRLLEAKREAGTVVLDLTESNPTHAGIPCPLDLLHALAAPAGLRYEPAPTGLLVAREAVAADYARRGYRSSADRIVLTASSSEAYAHLFKLLCDPGERVLVPAPSYPLFEFLAGLESVDIDRYPLTFDGEWHLQLSGLEALANSRTRAVVVVNPNNPTGSYLKRDEAAALVAFCAVRGLAVISDEVFADYAFGDDARRVSSLAGNDDALVFCLGGLSKSCGLPQVKLGWIAVAGPAALRDEALARLEIVADTSLSVATPVQHAAPRWLAQLPTLQAPIATRIRENLDAVQRLAGRDSPITPLPVEGGWYAVLRVPATLPEEERICRLLERHDVLVHSGYFFDFPGEAYLVLSLLARTADFAAGLDRIAADLVL
jgi:alanine-synthesizing transaminase